MTDWSGPATKLTLATFNFQDGGWGRPHGDYRDLPLLGDLVGTDPWDAACQRLAGLNHALTEAGRHLKALPAGPVTDDERYGLGALVASLCAQIPELTGRIERLFDDTGQAAVPVPAR